MSLDYYNSLMEAVYLLKSPANAAHLAKSISQYTKVITLKGIQDPVTQYSLFRKLFISSACRMASW